MSRNPSTSEGKPPDRESGVWRGRVVRLWRRWLGYGLGNPGRRSTLPAMPPAPVFREPGEAGRLLSRVGVEWTLAEWMRTQTGVDLPGLIRLHILRDAAEAAVARGRRFRGGRDAVERGLLELGIIPDLWEGYLSCLCMEYERFLAARPDLPLTYFEFCGRWVAHERALVREAAPRDLGVEGRLDAIRLALRRITSPPCPTVHGGGSEPVRRLRV